MAGVELGDNATLRLDADNEFQPDALWRIGAEGRSQIRDDDYVRSHSVESSPYVVLGARGDRSFFTQASLSVQSSDCLVLGVRGDRSLWVMGRSLLGQSSHWNGRNG
ncbi:hypothetical protein QUA62_01760 [Microcoleus sp. MON1_C1]|uniref:hypothetical protein n=1 Tax=Microcoleus sp. MON1_C1 TaxID=2818827 RepID=UPI002FD1964E